MYYTILAAKHKGTDIVSLDGSGTGWLDAVEVTGPSFQQAIQVAANRLELSGEIGQVAGNPSTKFRAVVGEDWMDFILVHTSSS